MRQRLIRLCIALVCSVAVGLPQAGLARGRGLQADFTDLPTDGSSVVSAGIALSRSAGLIGIKNGSAAVQLRQEHLQFQAAVALLLEGSGQPAPAAACAKLSAGEVAWFAADADGNVDTGRPVDSYADGVMILAPGFKYACAPKDVEIVVIIYNETYGDQPALVDKRTLRASPTAAGVFFYGLTTPDDQPLQSGKWRVAFYLGRTFLTSGEVVVGGETSLDATQQARLQGAIRDLRTGQPVAGARVFILNPGVTIEDFTRDPRNEDIYAQTRTDDLGQFALWKPLERNTVYAVLIAADGYKLRGANNLTIGDDAETPVNLDIQVIKK